MQDTPFNIGKQSFKSRLIVGTGKYKDFNETRLAIEESGAEIVTVAVRRVNITDRKSENLLDFIDPKRWQISAQHRGMLHGRRSDSHLPPRARGRRRRRW